MFNMNEVDKKNLERIDLEIKNLSEVLNETDPTSSEYKIVVNNLKDLMETREKFMSSFAKAKDAEVKEADAELKKKDAIIKEADAELKKMDAKLKEADIDLKKADTKNKVADQILKEVEAKLKQAELEQLQGEDDIPLLKRIDPNVVVKGAVALLGIGAVLVYEAGGNIIKSKAFGLVGRMLC